MSIRRIENYYIKLYNFLCQGSGSGFLIRIRSKVVRMCNTACKYFTCLIPNKLQVPPKSALPAVWTRPSAILKMMLQHGGQWRHAVRSCGGEPSPATGSSCTARSPFSSNQPTLFFLCQPVKSQLRIFMRSIVCWIIRHQLVKWRRSFGYAENA